jgi:hypothetical protein
MRNSFSLVLALMAAACGKSATMPGGDDGMPPDASMMGSGGAPQFEIVTKDAMIQPGDQVTYCYHFHTPNTSDVLINKWVSDMTAGSHHAILFLIPAGSTVPDGTLDTANCNPGMGEAWTFSASTEHYELDLPPDDGTGKPLAQKVPPNTAGVFQLHYLNASDQPIMAHMDLKAYGLAPGTAYTQTDAYVTYQYQIHIPAGATHVTVPGQCSPPAGAKFWELSTHAHKQAIATQVADGANVLFSSTDWEHPGSALFMTPDKFHTFTGVLAWQCTYNNNAPPPFCDQGGPAGSCSNADTAISQGLSAETDEMCMATSYYFPATGPRFEVGFGPSNCMGF